MTTEDPKKTPNPSWKCARLKPRITFRVKTKTQIFYFSKFPLAAFLQS